jgi:hypothetical protein
MPQSTTKSIHQKITRAMLVAALSGAMVALPAVSGAQTANAGPVHSKPSANHKGKAPVRPSRNNSNAGFDTAESSTTAATAGTNKTEISPERRRSYREAIIKRVQKFRDATRERYRKIRESIQARRAAKREKKFQQVEQKFQAVTEALKAGTKVDVTLMVTHQGILKSRDVFVISKNGFKVDITQGMKLSPVTTDISVNDVPSTLARRIPISSQVQVYNVINKDNVA